MSKYKVGDKVVLEITKGKTLLGTDYYLFNDGFGIRQGLVELNAEPLTTYTEQARAEGQNEAWELARKIVSDIYHGGYNSDELKEIFGYFLYQNIWEDNTYPEAAAKVAEWEKAKEEIKEKFNRGDEVEHKKTRYKGVVTRVLERMNKITVMFKDGSSEYYPSEMFYKTGRHIDIEGLLKQIGGEEG